MPDHAYIPPGEGSLVPHVGTYRRVLPANLERMFENALDWEHLPYLHDSSFASIRCLRSGAWGWHAVVGNHDGSESELELRLDRRSRRWVTRNIAGPNAGAEIWTYVVELDRERIEIFVDFFVPGVPEEAREKVGRAYAKAYEVLYDEDVRMMTGRQDALDRRIEGLDRQVQELDLGAASDLKLPMQASFAGREVIVARAEGQIVVYPARCPHMLAPLADVPLEGSRLRCPWHGYEFDVIARECVSGQTCRFDVGIEAMELDGRVVLKRRG